MVECEFIPDTLTHLAVPIDSLTPYEGNARRGNMDGITASIRNHGQYRPIVVNSRQIDGTSNVILAGNHTWQAMVDAGASHIAVTFVDVDADRAARINLIDNKLSDSATNDIDALFAQLSALPDIAGTGYSPDEMDDLIIQLGRVEVMPFVEFHGTYAETEAEFERRRQAAALALRGDGAVAVDARPETPNGTGVVPLTYKQFVVAMSTDLYAQMMRDIEALSERYECGDRAAVVAEALHREAKR